jgi:hypothetical protein
MLIGLVFASDLPGLSLTGKLPQVIKRMVAAVVFAAGCWNVFWYGLQHATEFWGQMALISGVLMIAASLYIANVVRAQGWPWRIKPLVLLGLLLCMLKYAHTIYNL